MTQTLSSATTLETKTLECYHCGKPCTKEAIHSKDEHVFCCSGCLAVYDILTKNSLCDYYALEKHPGNTIEMDQDSYQALDVPEIASSLYNFQDTERARAELYIPTIHCVSCIWLLEHLQKLDPGIIKSEVRFLEKKVSILFLKQKTTIRRIVQLLKELGYEPHLSLSKETVSTYKYTNPITSRLAFAGFAAGNVMLLSFPEYLGMDESAVDNFRPLFSYLSLAISIPTLLYSGWPYFQSVFQSLASKKINLDTPILVGVLATFFRSVYEIISQTGAGYLDSMCGSLFFLLIGKWLQARTFRFLKFERDVNSFFPLAVELLQGNNWIVKPVQQLQKGDKIRIRHNQVIPADGLLYKGDAALDYSFVTGESVVSNHKPGDLVYAGGRQTAGNIEIELVKDMDHSYLTSLWNHAIFKKQYSKSVKTFADRVGTYFTYTVLSLALGVAAYWYFVDPSKTWNTFSAILIIACPCTLAISYPVALSNMLRAFGRRGFFVKDTETIERMSYITDMVWDKTGTLTYQKSENLIWRGEYLSKETLAALHSITSNSTHPLAEMLHQYLPKPIEEVSCKNFCEHTGKGMEAYYKGVHIKLGSAAFVGAESKQDYTQIWLSIGGVVQGHFQVASELRPGIEAIFQKMKAFYKLHILSGDKSKDEHMLQDKLGTDIDMHFNQDPHQKRAYIELLQAQGKTVMMIGDGLNDAGAMQQSQVAIAITEHVNQFSPSSDAILEAKNVVLLHAFIQAAKKSLNVVRLSFVFSLVYNMVGLYFAVQGSLSPMVAAILMPLNSMTMVAVAFFGTQRVIAKMPSGSVKRNLKSQTIGLQTKPCEI